MNKNQIEGSVKDVAGKVQQKVGDITGNSNQQVKGAVKQVQGKVQKSVVDLQQAARDSAKASGDKR